MSNLVKYSLLSFPIASFGLGVWQIKRLEWKKGVIARLNDRLTGEPLDLNVLDSIDEKNLHQYEYRRFKTKGRFDRHPKHQLYIQPRQLVINDEALKRGRTSFQANIGANVITPFIIEGSNKRILVNRGWLAAKGKDSIEDSAHLGLGPENADIELVGLLRLTDKRPRYGLINNETSQNWSVRDIEAMSRVLKTEPIFLDAETSLSPGKGPIGGQTQMNIRNEHLNYAITWFGLTLFSYLMWHSKYGKGKFLSANRNWR